MSKESKSLWIIAVVKLFIMFGILKMFFFKDFLKTNFESNEQRIEYLQNTLTKIKNRNITTMNHIDWELVNWSRAQFVHPAMYHWLFVPLTLGITFIIAIMETIYVKTGDEKWKEITKFWMKLFGINFAIGVATGIIMEFEFGTNWSNYSWFCRRYFRAPLAIEGIMAFFMESTFIAVMFFGWDKVSKKFHLLSSWLVALGSNLSALWILVANGWMQHPVGMEFNPDTMRNEMVDFGRF